MKTVTHKHTAEPPACCGGKGPDRHVHHHAHAPVTPSATAKYFCPMCPGVESD
jgi:Cu+-exporting ATPase